MVRQISEIRVVVSSPSDVLPERQAVFDAIEQLNAAYSAKGIFVRGLGWEQLSPGIDDSAQKLINKHVVTGHDILIALFWRRLGSPTQSHRSGTIEEIELARLNSSSPFGEFRLQVYFKDEIGKGSEIDSPEDFLKVLSYRKELAETGVLYKNFSIKDDLSRLVRTNIQNAVEFFLSNSSLTPQNIVINNANSFDDEDPGLLDLFATAETSFSEATRLTYELTEIIGQIGERTRQAAKNIELLPDFPVAQKHKAINDFASFIRTKAVNLKRTAEASQTNYNQSFDAMILILGINRSELPSAVYSARVEEALRAMEGMLLGISEARINTSEYRDAVAATPALTIQYKKAKRELLESIDACLAMFNETEAKIFEVTSKA
jgi:hypothetical protein